jgi:hypothetical protein
MDVAGREVEDLGAGRGYDVGGVARQEKPAEPHRLGNKAAQQRDALLDRRPERIEQRAKPRSWLT